MRNKEDMKKSGRASSSKSGQMDSLHVTFADHPDQYVINSDSGIFLANDDVMTETPAVIDKNKCDKVQVNKPVRPILKLQKCVSVESQDNPFLMDGELMKKADYIINNSTISRKRIRIADPDLVKTESSRQTASETQSKPGAACSELVKIVGTEATGTNCLSKDDFVVMDICSSDSNKDQSSLEDVRSLTTIDRSPSHIREAPSNQLKPEVRYDANSHPGDAHDRLLVNLPEEDTEYPETSRPLLPHQTSNLESVEHHPSSAQKANGTNPHLRSSQPKSTETSTNSKTGANSRAKKKKKCCLLQ